MRILCIGNSFSVDATRYLHQIARCDKTELEIHIRPIEATAERHLLFKFSDDNVVMKPSSWPEASVMADTLKETVKDVVKQPFLQNALSTALPHIVPIIDLVHIGRVVKK